MHLKTDGREGARPDRDKGSPEGKAARDEAITKTYILSTKRQRAYWVRLMLDEKKRTGDASLNLSEWIMRQLPAPDESVDSERSITSYSVMLEGAFLLLIN